MTEATYKILKGSFIGIFVGIINFISIIIGADQAVEDLKDYPELKKVTAAVLRDLTSYIFGLGFAIFVWSLLIFVMLPLTAIMYVLYNKEKINENIRLGYLEFFGLFIGLAISAFFYS